MSREVMAVGSAPFPNRRALAGGGRSPEERMLDALESLAASLAPQQMTFKITLSLGIGESITENIPGGKWNSFTVSVFSGQLDICLGSTAGAVPDFRYAVTAQPAFNPLPFREERALNFKNSGAVALTATVFVQCY